MYGGGQNLSLSGDQRDFIQMNLFKIEMYCVRCFILKLPRPSGAIKKSIIKLLEIIMLDAIIIQSSLDSNYNIINPLISLLPFNKCGCVTMLKWISRDLTCCGVEGITGGKGGVFDFRKSFII